MFVELDERTIELTNEQVATYETLTRLQRSLALASLAGKSLAEAHLAAGGKSRVESQRANLAAQILTNPNVEAFLSSFKCLDASKIALAVLSRDEILVDLSDIARTTLDDVVSFSERPLVDMENGMEVLSSTIHIRSIDEISPGARKAIKSVKQTKYGLEVQMYDGLSARKQITEMCGYDAPTKIEQTGPNGGPMQVQEILDEDIEQKLRTLGLGRYHNQLESKKV